MALLAKIGYGQVEPNSINAKRTGAILSDVPLSTEAFTAVNQKVEQGMFFTLEAGKGVQSNLKTAQLVLPKAENGLELTVVQITTMPDGQKAVKLMVTAEGDGKTQLVYNEEKLYHNSQGRKDFVLTTNGEGNIFINRQSPYRDASKEALDTVVPRMFKLIVGDRYTTNLIDEANPAVGDVFTPGVAGVLVKKV